MFGELGKALFVASRTHVHIIYIVNLNKNNFILHGEIVLPQILYTLSRLFEGLHNIFSTITIYSPVFDLRGPVFVAVGVLLRLFDFPHIRKHNN